MQNKTIVIASTNPGKIAEIQSLLSPLGWKIILPEKDLIFSAVETASTFLENALQKARLASGKIHLPAIADDSGLCVPALGGAPGLLSARFGGLNTTDEANRALLLKRMAGVPFKKRDAYFYCVTVFLSAWDDPLPLVGEGLWKGYITFEPKGHSGFGYDSVFYVPTHRCTAAELACDEKNRISHRGQAVREMVTKMRAFTG
ncbi:MAG: RdgB/HAM1 family non-canonical purine NTP pyrophosphatase [Gammaproteobacteria bacterium]|nr:RdgB/HAM1 family non-canonical purine NTP pyrophosphatase [Gammaproteobacteria bacterium]